MCHQLLSEFSLTVCPVICINAFQVATTPSKASSSSVFIYSPISVPLILISEKDTMKPPVNENVIVFPYLHPNQVLFAVSPSVLMFMEAQEQYSPLQAQLLPLHIQVVAGMVLL